jgi:hypothetical protein
MPLMQVVDNASAASNGGEFAGMQASLLSTEQLRQLFSLLPDTPSDTYELLCGQADEEGEWRRGGGRSAGAGQGVIMHGTGVPRDGTTAMAQAQALTAAGGCAECLPVIHASMLCPDVTD